ncbi:MAG TPA: multicopper oxidase domain-containing protein [Gemmatimonadaceae bacterium]|nr:multicopper oxidase domain-containing protein [Gemmatimonadaceae bacterium]
MSSMFHRTTGATGALRYCAAGATLLVSSLAVAAGPGARSLPELRPNANTMTAGTLHDGVLTLALDARQTLWRFNPARPPMLVAAFSEAGKPPLMPGPFVRVPAGTQLHLTIRNSLDKPLTFSMPEALHGGPDQIRARDTLVIAPGAIDSLSVRATVPGGYVYHAGIPDGATKISHMAGALVGTIVVDSVGTPAKAIEPVFVIMATEDAPSSACDDTTTGPNPLAECKGRRFMYTINGVEWPETPRMHATVGDSLHWRVINGSAQVHPMHLHGFYYRVDALTGPLVDESSRPVPGQLVVTQLLQPQTSMSMTWSPERPGNWLFHCHFALHNTSYSMIAMAGDPDMRDMAGLVIGTIVAPRPGVVMAGAPAPARRLRLVAEQSPTPSGGKGALPRKHFVLEEGARRVDNRTDWSPEIDLVRGQPVAITIVNHLDEPTSVHWHGIEVEDSYMDGAPGFSGAGTHLSPAIAPGDSFVARFAPPRSGTFMYHAHIDELSEEMAGLEGALIVRDSSTGADPDDHPIFLKGSPGDRAHPIEIDGQANPDTIVLRLGRPARFRLMNLADGVGGAVPFVWLTARPDSAAAMVRDSMLVRWQRIAKDGFDLPAAARGPRPADQIVAVGETYDFLYTPATNGLLRLEVRGSGANHGLLIRVPIRVQ